MSAELATGDDVDLQPGIALTTPRLWAYAASHPFFPQALIRVRLPDPIADRLRLELELPPEFLCRRSSAYQLPVN